MIEEIMMGAMVGAWLAPVFGWHTIWVTAFTAGLWRLGGADGYSKGYRRLGVSGVVAGCLLHTFSDPIFLITGLCMWGVLSIGYGIPD